MRIYLFLSLLVMSWNVQASELKEDIYILASSSMSESSLKQLVKDAEKANLPVYFRGLIKKSYKETALYFKKIGVGITIDPRPFREFSQKQVPAFVFKSKEKTLIIKGNVPLSYALEKFQECIPNIKDFIGKKRGVK